METWQEWLFADAVGIGSLVVIVTTCLIVGGIGGMLVYKAMKKPEKQD